MAPGDDAPRLPPLLLLLPPSSVAFAGAPVGSGVSWAVAEMVSLGPMLPGITAASLKAVIWMVVIPCDEDTVIAVTQSGSEQSTRTLIKIFKFGHIEIFRGELDMGN